MGQGDNEVAYSVDGISWTSVSTDFSGGSGNGLCISSDKIVAVGVGSSTDTIYSTNGGLTWVSTGSTIFGGQGMDVFWNGTDYCAVGGSAVNIATSFDGINWNSVSSVFSGGYAHSVYWTGKKWVVSGDNTNSSPIVYSMDGTDWYNSDASSTLFSACYSIVGNNSVSAVNIPNALFIKSAEQVVITSPDYYGDGITSPTSIDFVFNPN